MGSNRADVEVSYDVSNEFFRLWLDERMNYTSAVYETMEQTGPMAPSEEGQSLEKAQQNKLHILSEMARVTPDKTVLDIGCGWGSCLEYLSGVREVKRAVGVTLSTEQAREVNERKIPRVQCVGSDFMKWETDEKFDAVISICMIDHLCSPQEAREGKAVGIYREYFKRVHALTKPGSQFALQAILRNRTPRIKKDLEDVFFTTKIFPGGLNPRLEDLVMAVNPYWEIMTIHTRRQHYQRTTLEWLRRMRGHEAAIRKEWGDQVFDDYDRYLSTCVRAFEMHYSSLAQLELRRIDLPMTEPKADILAQFKTIATRINHKSFDHVTRESVITELGIDSLSTMQIVGELETEFDIMIPDEDLVEMVTVGDLCKKIETRILAARATMETRLEERLYNEYIGFFEKAERERRWNVFNDIPWDQVNKEASEDLAWCAETFCSVEMYLPDYVAGGINLVRKYFGQAWFQANWAYEESKHSLALTHWLIKSGKRTEGQMFDLQNQILSKKWELPFETPRRMTFYGCVQEMATFVIYCKHRDMAKREGDEALRQIYDFVARDEIAHCRFYQGVTKVLLEEDREGTLEDMAHVFANFQMPGVNLVPDYDERVLKMREAGIDRTVFIQKVYIPILKYLGVNRHEMLRAQGKAIEAKKLADEAAGLIVDSRGDAVSLAHAGE